MNLAGGILDLNVSICWVYDEYTFSKRTHHVYYNPEQQKYVAIKVHLLICMRAHTRWDASI